MLEKEFLSSTLQNICIYICILLLILYNSGPATFQICGWVFFKAQICQNNQ